LRSGLGREAGRIESQRFGVAGEISPGEVALMCDELIVHAPELSLCGRRLGRLGCDLGVRMYVGERKVSPHIAQVVGKRCEQFADNTFGQTAVLAFVVVYSTRVIGASAPPRM
jgi:hypothetical protein